MTTMDAFDENHIPRPTGDDDSQLGIRALSVASSRARIASQAGITFSNDRDLYQALGYKRDLTCEDMRQAYERGDIAARIVEAYPKATWRKGVELIEDEEPEIVTEFEEAVEALNERLNLWPLLQRADILAGMGDYAAVLIGAPGDPAQELGKMGGPDGIMFLAPYGQRDLEVMTLDNDPMSPRFGQPVAYKLKRRTNGSSIDRTIHWTRVIHIADNVLDDPINGNPLLRRVWNRLDDKDKVVGGGSEAYWLRVHMGLVFNLDPALKVEATELAKLKEEAEEFAHNMRRTIAARGFTVDALTSDVSNFSNQLDAIVTLIASATGIPKRILLGSERGELSSSQDSETWDEKVRDRRNEFGTPTVKGVINRFIQYGALPEPKLYTVRWPDITELTESEKATIAGAWAGLSGKAGGTVVTPAEIRDKVLGLPKLTPEQIAENAPEPVPDQLQPEEEPNVEEATVDEDDA